MITNLLSRVIQKLYQLFQGKRLFAGVRPKVASVEYGFGLSQNLAKGGLLYLFFQLLWPIKNIVYLVGLTSRYLFKDQEFVT